MEKVNSLTTVEILRTVMKMNTQKIEERILRFFNLKSSVKKAGSTSRFSVFNFFFFSLQDFSLRSRTSLSVRDETVPPYVSSAYAPSIGRIVHRLGWISFLFEVPVGCPYVASSFHSVHQKKVGLFFLLFWDVPLGVFLVQYERKPFDFQKDPTPVAFF